MVVSFVKSVRREVGHLLTLEGCVGIFACDYDSEFADLEHLGMRS